MSKKTDIKTCRYARCSHPDKLIDITKDNYHVEGRMYYHADCYNLKKKGDWKDEQTKKDLQYIKNQWVLHINKTVVYSQLFHCLNDFIAHGVSSEYLVFVLDYVIKNKMNLRHPQGFKYYVDRQEIKDAYQKHLIAKSGAGNKSNFVVTDDSSTAPKFSVSQKPMGFKSILGGKK